MKSIAILLALLITVGEMAQGSPAPIRWNASRPKSEQDSKKDVLAKLKVLQDKQLSESTELENAIRRQLNETLNLQVGGNDLAVAGRRTNLVTKKIDELNKRRAELNARREIVDRLIFQIDSKWDGHSKLQDFLTRTFIEMASTDLSDGRDNRLWKEFTYLSMVMREVPDQNEDVVAVVEGYLNFASVFDPKTPAEFMASRNYTNGLESVQAHGVDRENLGDGLGPAGPSRPTGVIKATIASDMVPQPPPAQTPIAKSPVETTDKAQLDSGQVPMAATAPAGKADSPEAAPLLNGSATRANSTTSATSQSAADLAAHAKKEDAKPAPPVSK